MRLFFIIVSILVSGCASSVPKEDFLQLSPQSQASLVCSDADLAKDRSRYIEAIEKNIDEKESLLEQGYRVHKQCKNVEKKTSESKQDCGGATGIDLQLCNMNNSTQGYKYYTTECTETPIPIDYNHEKNVLGELQLQLIDAIESDRKATDDCLLRVYSLSSDRKYLLYKNGLDR